MKCSVFVMILGLVSCASYQEIGNRKIANEQDLISCSDLSLVGEYDFSHTPERGGVTINFKKKFEKSMIPRTNILGFKVSVDDIDIRRKDGSPLDKQMKVSGESSLEDFYSSHPYTSLVSGNGTEEGCAIVYWSKTRDGYFEADDSSLTYITELFDDGSFWVGDQISESPSRMRISLFKKN